LALLGSLDLFKPGVGGGGGMSRWIGGGGVTCCSAGPAVRGGAEERHED